MWTYQGKGMKPGRSWTDANGTMYPAQWYGRTTDAEKIAAGWVWTDEPASFDSRFYWSADHPKDLNNLKADAIAKTKATAGALLAPTDWYIVREQETGEVTPTEILNYRQAVRTASGDIETALTGATTHAEFITAYDTNINDWPEEL